MDSYESKSFLFFLDLNLLFYFFIGIVFIGSEFGLLGYEKRNLLLVLDLNMLLGVFVVNIYIIN